MTWPRTPYRPTPGRFINTMHIFDPNVAAEYGIAEAVIIQHFQFWIGNNKRNGRNENDGRTWTYNTTKALAETFPYLTEKQIWLAINRLVDAGVLMRGNYNQTAYDRTTWYAFTLESFWIVPEGNFHFPRRENRTADRVEPIPDTPPDTYASEKPNTPPGQSAGGKKTEPKKTAQPKKTPGAGDADWQRWVDAWHDFFKGRHDQIEPVWNGAQLGALKKLRTYLCKVATQVDGKSRDDCGFSAWSFILENWDLLDEWQRGQFDLTVVYQKINNVLTQIKHGTQTHRGAHSGGAESGTSASRVAAVANY